MTLRPVTEMYPNLDISGTNETERMSYVRDSAAGYNNEN